MRIHIAAAIALAAAACSGEDAYGPRVEDDGNQSESPAPARTGGEQAAGNAVTGPAGRTSDGGQWFSKAGERGPWAGFGPPASEAAFSARCENGTLIFNTTEMPPSGPGDTVMRLSAPGIERDVPATASERGLPNTDAPVDASEQWLGELQSASGELVVRVGGSDPLRVPISTPLTSLIRDCRR